MLIIIVTALGLSMDAFSLALLYGTNNISFLKKIALSLLVGINHLLFPLIGQKLGVKILNNNIIDINLITMVIFLIIGLEMIISNEKESEVKVFSTFEMLLFAFGVSIDSFVIGMTYQHNSRILLAGIVFMLFSGFLTYTGLKIGQYVNEKIGKISKKLGGLLIILVGLYSLFA